MAIIKGQKTVGALFRGRTPVIKVYRGKVMVFPSSSPEPPVGQYNFQGKFRDDSTSSEWWCNLYNTGRASMADMVDPATKRFDFDLDPRGTLYDLFYRNEAIEEVNAVPTEGVTSFREMFGECRYLKKVDASDWDTSLSTNFNSMFYNCYLLEELDCSSWDVSKATDINYMFAHCQSLERLILGCQFHFDSVTPKSGMNIFNDCPKLKYIRCTQKFKNWCLANQGFILLPDAMKEGGDGVWDVIDCSKLLSGKFTDDSTAEDWWIYDVASKKNVSIAEHVDPSTKKFSFMYEGSRVDALFNENQKLERCYTMPTEGMTNMSFVFYLCNSLKSVDTSAWDVSGVTNIHNMFEFCYSLEEIDMSPFEKAKPLYVYGLFGECHSLRSVTGLSRLDVSKSDGDYVFYECEELTSIDISGWTLRSDTKYTDMFSGCAKLQRLLADGLEPTTRTDTSYISNMFKGCNSLNYVRTTKRFRDWCIANQDTIKLPEAMREGGSGVWDLVDDTNENYISGKLASRLGAYYNANGNTAQVKWFSNDVSSDLTFRTVFSVAENGNTIDYLFAENDEIERIDHIPVKGITNIESPFTQMDSLTYINLGGWDTSQVVDAHWLFYYMSSLETIEGISEWDVSKATRLNTMFYRCTKLEELDLSGWYTPVVSNMNYFIGGCSKLKRLLIDKMDVSSLQTANGFFENCSSLNYIRCKKSFKDWCMANATAMQLPTAMREGGSGIWDLTDAVKQHNFQGKFRDDSTSDNWWYYDNTNTKTYMGDKVDPETKRFNFDISTDGTLYRLFFNNNAIEEVNAVPTEGVVKFTNMFNGCTSLNQLDCSSWDVSKATDFNSMFNNCTSLNQLDCSSWDVSNVTVFRNMFNNCTSLNYVRCKEQFKDWCFAHADDIGLPGQLRDGGTGVWDIID